MKSNLDLSSGRTDSRARRSFLKLAGIAGLLASVPTSLKAIFMNELYIRTVEKNSFVFKDNTIFGKDKNKSESYSFIISGLANNKVNLSYPDLLKLPQVHQTSDFHCVEGWSVENLVWSGIRFQEILKIARPAQEAKYVVFHALGETSSTPKGQNNYVECLPIRHLLDPQKECLLALKMNGRPLSYDHGAPMRVVAPYDLGYKSIKFVYRVDFVKEVKPGWWTLANPIYTIDAPVPASRLRTKPGAGVRVN
jgi:DMSO/TMAO reductase YedYZ molybdopterin-dependent catalytic subunit